MFQLEFRMIRNIVLLFLSLTFTSVSLLGQNSTYAKRWVDSCFQTMTLDHKLGQLFMIRAHSDLGQEHINDVKSQIEKYKVGGLCFFQGTPTKQAELTNEYQGLSDFPLMVAMDAEWGLGMRHKKKALSYPKQMTLGALRNNTLIYEMGMDIASHLKRIGAHINFAPVADVNNNPKNPVIHNRSFGEDIYNVATKSYAYTKGLQDQHVLACAKHFPGHGDTDIDSHYDLPVIQHDKSRLDSLELMPFRVLSQLGVRSMMTAHLSVPALDPRENRPASLSHPIISDLLRDKMNFEGLLFTDGLEMEGVAKHFAPGEMELEAIKAGNDILLLPINIEKAFARLKEAVESGELPMSLIDDKVKRILQEKYYLELYKDVMVQDIEKIDSFVNNNNSKALISTLYQKSMTLVVDENEWVPVKNGIVSKMASLSIGAQQENTFQERLNSLGIEKNLHLEKNFTADAKSKVLGQLRAYDHLIVSIHDMSIYKSRDYGISKSTFELLYRLNNEKKVTLVVFGTPYALEYFKDFKSILLAYEDNDFSQDAAAQALMGVNRIEGNLPVGVTEKFPVKSGIKRAGLFRLGYALPESVGMSSDSLLAIDTIVAEMLDKKATPGCQILAAKDGKIFFNKSYGKHTPDGRTDVENSDVYDIASVTKILATTIALMKLYEEGELNLYNQLNKYIPETDTTNKSNLIIEDILAHHAGLPGWIPFYKRTLEEDHKDHKRLECYYSETESDSFCLQVCNNLYLRKDWRDSIYQIIYNCELREKRDYRYSDLGFYLFQKIIETQSNLPLDQYVGKYFYKPLNLRRTCFNPHQCLPKEDIVPSEKDDYYRHCVLHGYVHDMGAAMMGGVAGHAGLFSNATELAVIMQMLLNGGTYGGDRFFKPETVERFTKRYYNSTRRGLGFDMKELDPDKTLNMAEEASELTFGHLGFTGIAVFADPKYDLIYIMLSNRTYPTMKNYIFAKENYRPRIQSVFYNAMKKPSS